MKNIYTFTILLSFILLPGCSKDFLKKYDKRIIGTWHITDINRNGIGGSASNLNFRDGTFTFRDDGSLTYINSANITYQGSWDIKKKTIDDETFHSLLITAVDYINQQELKEYYDDINFTGSDHIKAKVISTLYTYVIHFKR
jgi:ATP-dependent phosphoenolpyruvate carboxykinase